MMRMAWLFFGLVFIGNLSAVETHRVRLRPMDLDYGAFESFLTSIGQMESDGEYLYFRMNNTPEIIVAHIKGEVVRIIGGKGGHPSELGEGVLAMAVRPGLVWAVGGAGKRARLFKDGSFHSYIDIDPPHGIGGIHTSNVFSFSEDRVVIPTKPENGSLALAYSLDGKERRPVGELLDFSDELKLKVSAINDTMWLYEDGAWYSVHKFFPVLTVYNRRFEMVNQFSIEHPEIHKYLEYLNDFEPTKNFMGPRPLITDFKIFRGDLYLMCNGALFQLDQNSGRVKTVTRFYGQGDDFDTSENKDLFLAFCVFLENGQILVGHPAMLWEHEFWKAETPFLKKGP